MTYKFRCEWCLYTRKQDYNIKLKPGRGIWQYCPNCMRVKPQWRIQ